MVTHLVEAMGVSLFEALDIRRDLLPGLPMAGTIVSSKGVLDADHSFGAISMPVLTLRFPARLEALVEEVMRRCAAICNVSHVY